MNHLLLLLAIQVLPGQADQVFPLRSHVHGCDQLNCLTRLQHFHWKLVLELGLDDHLVPFWKVDLYMAGLSLTPVKHLQAMLLTSDRDEGSAKRCTRGLRRLTLLFL